MDKSVISVFWASVLVFIALVSVVIVGLAVGYAATIAIVPLSIIFTALGFALAIMAAKSGVGTALKRFLVFTGVCSVATLVAYVLHILVSAMFLDFWNSSGIGDEPFFFIMFFILVIAYVVGVAGSLVLMARGGKPA